MTVRDLLVLVGLGAVGLAGTLAGLAGRGEDEAFLVRQQNPVRVHGAAVEKLLLSVPDPEPPHRMTARHATCRAAGTRELRNPWRCTVRYPRDRSVPLLVTIAYDGSYVAEYVDDPGNASATGCCLELPGVD